MLAIDLRDYHERSTSALPGAACVDPLPVLTETGGGAAMLFFDGASLDTTYKLFGAWRWDVLQIVAEAPGGYEIVPCCFSPMYSNVVTMVHERNGCDETGLVLGDDKWPYRLLRFSVAKGTPAVYCVSAGKPVEEDGYLCVDYTFVPIHRL
jgi:hypothetical protein